MPFDIVSAVATLANGANDVVVKTTIRTFDLIHTLSHPDFLFCGRPNGTGARNAPLRKCSGGVNGIGRTPKGRPYGNVPAA